MEPQSPDENNDPIILDERALKTIAPCADRAQACFAAAPLLSEIAVCGAVYDRPGQAAAMSVAHVVWLAPSGSGFDFVAAAAEDDCFAAAAMRFQNAAVPPGRSNVLGVIMQAARAAFVTSILHFARSGRIRLAPGSISLQRIRFMQLSDHDTPDVSGIHSVFLSAPSHHDLILAESTIPDDFAAFQR